MASRDKDKSENEKRKDLSDAEIRHIAKLVAERVRESLNQVSSPLGSDCGAGFNCNTEYSCEGGFTCYAFDCRQDFVCDVGNKFVCPRTFNCHNSFTRPEEDA